MGWWGSGYTVVLGDGWIGRKGKGGGKDNGRINVFKRAHILVSSLKPLLAAAQPGQGRTHFFLNTKSVRRSHFFMGGRGGEERKGKQQRELARERESARARRETRGDGRKGGGGGRGGGIGQS